MIFTSALSPDKQPVVARYRAERPAHFSKLSEVGEVALADQPAGHLSSWLAAQTAALGRDAGPAEAETTPSGGVFVCDVLMSA